MTLIENLKKNYLKSNGFLNFKKLTPEIKQEILDSTDFLHPDESWSVRYYFILNHITSPILCRHCSQLFPQKKIQSGTLKNYCSITCVNSDRDDAINKAKQTCLTRYGVENPMKVDSVKNKCNSSRNTTVKKKYGVDNVFQLESVKNKIKLSYQKNYNAHHPMANENVKEKQQHTMSRLYKRKNASQIHISQATLDVLDNKSQLKSLFDSGGIDYINQKLSVTEMTTRKYLKYHNIISDCKNSYEELICSWLNENSIYHERNNRKIISPKEIDIIIPEFKIGIEINGAYWHSEKYGKNKNYHKNKIDLAGNSDYQLLQFWCHQIDNSPEIVKSMILNKVKKNKNIVYARKCIVTEIDSATYNQFCAENHIQGPQNSSVKIGIFHGEKLVSVMGFSKARFSKDAEWELIRYAVKKNTSVIGAASRLMQFFVRNFNPKSIISYANREYSNGNLYQKLGFKFSHNTDPDYFYSRNDEIISRFAAQKHKLKHFLKNYDSDLSEFENMTANGYYRVWKSGNSVWVWQTSNLCD